MNFCNRRFRISFASSDSPFVADDSFAKKVDVTVAGDGLSSAVSLLVLGWDDAEVDLLLASSKWSSLPTSSSFTWLWPTSDAFSSGFVDSSAPAVGAGGGGGIGSGGRLATTIWYWFIKAADAFSMVCTFLSSFSRSSTCRRSLPSIARSSSTVSWSRFWGIGGGGIVYGAMNGIDGKKKGGGIVAPRFGIVCGADIEAEVDAAGACWLPSPVWFSKFKNGFCCAPAAASFGLAFWFTALLLINGCCCCCCGCDAVIGVRRMFNRHVGHVCWRWNQDLKGKNEILVLLSWAVH